MRISHKYALGLLALVGALLLLAVLTIVGLLRLERNSGAVSEEFSEFVQVVRAEQAFSTVANEPADRAVAPPRRPVTRDAIERTLAVVIEIEAGQSRESKMSAAHGQAEVAGARAITDGLRGLLQVLDGAAADEPMAPDAVAEFDRRRDQAATDLGRLGKKIREAAVKVHSTSDNFYRRTRNFIISTCVAVLIGAVLFTFWMYRMITHPLRRLRSGVQTLSRGTEYPQIRLTGHDELTELAGEFNEMSRRLHDYYDTLERRVAEKSRQLVRSERLASTGFLAAGVAHEINNPLAAITGHAESLLRRLKQIEGSGAGGVGPPLDAEQGALFERYLATIRDEAFRCKEITTRLLDFSRLEQVGEAAPGGVELCAVVRETVELLGHVARYRDRRIELAQPPPGPVRVRGSVDQLKQVLMNLLVNALEATAGNGGLVRVGCELGPASAVVCVRDDGEGMDPETLEKVFEPFYSARTNHRGTGLGLPVSLAIVEAFGGQLTAASDGPGRGAAFTLTLPLAD